MHNINNTSPKKNCTIVVKTPGLFTFNSFKSIQFIISKHKKLYKNVWFKKIPKPNNFLFVNYLDILLEFLIISNIFPTLKLIKDITYKVSFKLKVFYIKNENNNWH